MHPQLRRRKSVSLSARTGCVFSPCSTTTGSPGGVPGSIVSSPSSVSRSAVQPVVRPTHRTVLHKSPHDHQCPVPLARREFLTRPTLRWYIEHLRLKAANIPPCGTVRRPGWKVVLFLPWVNPPLARPFSQLPARGAHLLESRTLSLMYNLPFGGWFRGDSTGRHITHQALCALRDAVFCDRIAPL